METLPNEIILLIFDLIPLITDKRQFLKTCQYYNKLTKQTFLHFEQNYEIKYLKRIRDYCMEKFTLELCHDKYFERIPTSYITRSNYIIIRALVMFDCIPLLEIAKKNNCSLQFACKNAATYGNLEVLKWARKNGGVFDKFVCAFAAEKGHLEILKWARENGCEWDEITCSYAAQNGNLEILKWARENGCKWDEWTCNNAARNGHFETLKWARENGCSWSSEVCVQAANNGDLKILKWARKNGCPWDNRVYRYANTKGHIELLKWAIENGCPI